MSRRASVFARKNPGKRRVRFPDEVIFENEIKEQVKQFNKVITYINITITKIIIASKLKVINSVILGN